MRYSKDFKNIHALCKVLDMNRSVVYHRLLCSRKDTC